MDEDPQKNKIVMIKDVKPRINDQTSIKIVLKNLQK
jgi:hypothetical protein